MANDRSTDTRVLGRLLVRTGAVSEADLERALAEQRRTRERLGEILVRHGTEPEQVARALADQLRLPYAPPPLAPDPSALRLVPRPLAIRLRVVPLSATERTLAAAMADPLDASAIDDLQFQTGRRVDPRVAMPGVIDRALMEAYGAEAVSALVTRLPGPAVPRSGEADDPDVGALRRASEAAPVVALVDHVLARAAASQASDVHVEPAGDRLQVRARVDGVLRPMLELPGHIAAAVTSRIKIMAGLDIAVKRRPQDGRTSLRIDGREVGVRVSTLPVGASEKAVLRLLDGAAAARDLDEVGLTGDTGRRFRALLRRGHGLILVTGPTGSGKTTTLYAALGTMDREGRNLLTLEDPVEYSLEGVAQVQVHPRAGLTFPVTLRAVLRQDPDVVMVGEMRDRETVEVGLAAALTGHLVLSTLHTTDAPGAVARLAEMGAPRYLIAGGLIGVLAQRLVRRLCRHCRRPDTVGAERLRELGLPAGSTPVFGPVGCPRCGSSGYRGRIGVFELLLVSGRVRELVLADASADAIRNAARADGMRPLAHDAWARVADGTTSIDEVAPLLALLADEAPVCPGCGAGIEAGHGWCPACGRALAARCGCGAVLRSHWRFCAACGRPATEDGAERDGVGDAYSSTATGAGGRPKPRAPAT